MAQSKKKQRGDTGNLRDGPPQKIAVSSSNAGSATGAQRSDNGEDVANRNWWWIGDRRANTIFAGAVAFFALVQVIVSNGQLQEMARQSDVLKSQLEQTGNAIERTDKAIEMARMEKRAWVSITRPEIEAFEPGKRVKCVATLTNRGATPARVVAVSIRVLPLPTKVEDEDVKFKEIHDDRADFASKPDRLTLPPGGQLNVTDDEFFEMLDSDLEKINKGEIELSDFGKCYYRDVINPEILHATFYAFYWDPEAKALYAHQSSNYMD